MSVLIPFGHPLHGAELRLARARQLIGTLNRQYARWGDAHGNVRVGLDEARSLLHVAPEIPQLERDRLVPRISITVGETAYNIRSSLDYLIYAIARTNNYLREVRGTQFPLEDYEEMYWARWTGKTPDGKKVAQFLRKVPRGVAEDLAHYQPFSGCKWAELLRDLSNPDKHRHLTTLNTRATFKPDTLGLGIVDPNTKQQSIHFKGRIEVSVFLPTGEDVVDALHLVQGEARALVRSYAGRFQLPGPRWV